jgi:hypothetical protein
VASEILEKLGANDELVNEVSDIIGHHHHPRSEETVNFKCVYDADMVANLEEEHKRTPMEAERLNKIIRESFLTESGRELARELLFPAK